MNKDKRDRKLKKDKEISKKKNEDKKSSEIIDSEYLRKELEKKLVQTNLDLLYVCALSLRTSGPKVDAVIYSKEGVSHDNCADVTREIKKIINDKGLSGDDYTITVSSPGFKWKFASDKEFEIFKNAPVKITYTREASKIIGSKTVCGILLGNKQGEIEIENERENISVSKKAIEKINLNY